MGYILLHYTIYSQFKYFISIRIYYIGLEPSLNIFRLKNSMGLNTGAYLGRGYGSRCPERQIFKDLEGRQIFI
jgi:hypothetical protein